MEVAIFYEEQRCLWAGEAVGEGEAPQRCAGLMISSRPGLCPPARARYCQGVVEDVLKDLESNGVRRSMRLFFAVYLACLSLDVVQVSTHTGVLKVFIYNMPSAAV